MNDLYNIRLDETQVKKQSNLVQEMDAFGTAFELTNILIAIINTYRQIIYVNKPFEKYLNIPREDIYGKRLGEAVSCLHSAESSYGCGTTEACDSCRAFEIIRKAMKQKDVASEEAFITQAVGDRYQLLSFTVNVAPVEVKSEQFYVVSLLDISDSIKKRTLEKVFFHDILNTTGALHGLIELMEDELPVQYKEQVKFMADAFQGMVDEIQSYKQIIDAESTELAVCKVILVPNEIVSSVVKLYENHELAIGKHIQVRFEAGDKKICSDDSILRRVLGNMLKNALEATVIDEVINIGCLFDIDQNEIEFYVRNRKCIEKSMQIRIFEKSFSTKGKGRGTGTYSMKLLGEKYLGGKIGFTSGEATGTRFYFRLPVIDSFCSNSGQPG